MKSTLLFIKNKTAFLCAVVIAAIVGGAATAVVSAAIPDSNSQINACYKNSTKVLSVTDPAGNCATNETALSWSQGSSPIAYAHTIWHADTTTNTLDTNRSKNITLLADLPDTAGMCMQVSFTPKNVVPDYAGFGNSAVKDENGWSDSTGEVCNSVSGANLFIPALDRNQFILVH